ncbi:MAG TPA: tetratricopeptide repeat protein, partial [Bryobacteraceae bacterium]
RQRTGRPDRGDRRGRGTAAVRIAAILAAFLATVACCITGAQVPEKSQPPSPGYALYQKADRLFVAQKFQESFDALDQALRLDPNLVPALTLRAKLAMAVNRWDVARESLERAIAADPSSWYAQFLYGFQFYRQNELPSAVQALEKARRLNPNDARTPLYLGLARESLGQTTEALKQYREAIRLGEVSGKLDTDMLLSYARLLMLMGDFEECGRQIQRALKLAPNSRDPHFESARLLQRTGDSAAAAREGEIALKLKTGDATDRQVHFLLVQAYQAMGKEQEAERHAAAIRALEDTEKK